MTVNQLNQRLELLINAHVWSRTNDKVKLNVFQRICLTQERAAIMEALEKISHVNLFDVDEIKTPKLKYQLPKHLDERVVKIGAIIRLTNWTKPKHEVEPY